MRISHLAFWLALGSVLLGPGVGWGFFEEPDVISSSGNPSMVVGGDFTGDGILDLAVSSPGVARIVVYPGRGDGTFRFPAGFDLGGTPTALATGDVDRNGFADLAWIDEPSGDVGVVFQFGPSPSTYEFEIHPGVDEPRDVVVVDLDGDTWPEVVTANHGADLVSVYPNLGGTLGLPELRDVGDGPSILVPLSPTVGSAFAVVQSGALSTNVGIYDESFEPLQLLSIEEPAGAAAIDWNGDAFPDLAVADRAGRGHVYVSGPTGFVTSETTWDAAPSASLVQAFRTVEGRPGALLLEEDRNRITVYAQNVSNDVEPVAGYFVGQRAGRFLWQDLDGDSSEELVVPLPEENILLIMGRNGDKLRGFPSVLSGRFPQQVEVVEAAAGLPPRAAVLCPGSAELWLYDISTTGLQASGQLAVSSGARRFRWGFVDGDTLPDLVIVDSAAGFSVYLAQGSGFGPAQIVNAPGGFRDLAIVDWGAGPETDIMLADEMVEGLRVFSPDGGGGYVEVDTLVCEDIPVTVAVRDLDLDGFDDVITLGGGNSMCLSYNGPGGLDQQTIFGVGEEPRGLAFGSFNSDMMPDMAVGNAGDETFTVLLSVLPRIYGFGAQNQVTPSGSQTAEAFDANDDGIDDLIFTSLTARSVSIHAGLGNGSFTVPARIRCSSLPFDLAKFDIDGDERQDLLVLDTLGDAVVSLLSSGAGGNPVSPPTGIDSTTSFATMVLAPVYPNPSDGLVHIRMRVGRELASTARVYDLRGRRVTDVHLRPAEAGWLSATWDGKDERGRSVARGRYLVEVRAGGSRAARSVILR